MYIDICICAYIYIYVYVCARQALLRVSLDEESPADLALVLRSRATKQCPAGNKTLSLSLSLLSIYVYICIYVY